MENKESTETEDTIRQREEELLKKFENARTELSRELGKVIRERIEADRQQRSRIHPQP